MIYVQLNKEDFEYDIHSLVKAFFPSENVSVYAADQGSPGRKRSDGKDSGREDQVQLKLCVDYRADEIAVVLQKADLTDMGQAVFSVDYSDRKDTKNRLKKAVYRLLSEYTGRTLPWGTLTGIRPTKIPMSMLEAGRPVSDIRAYMQKTYGISEEKTDLSIEIAQRELKLLNRLDYKKGYSLYIGIPFCPSTCLYCSFTSYPISAWKKRIDDYLDALEKEIEYTAEHFSGRPLNSIYIGGGTPTTLEPHQLDRLLTKLEQLDLSNLLEFTVEAGRPDSIDGPKLEVLRRHPVSRISINPQTMKQETLDLIGRRHTAVQTAESFRLARSMGFDNINMDLIMGLPQETLEDVRYTMNQLQMLEPDSITVHSLAVKRAARLQMFKEDYADLKIVNTQEHLDTAASVCAKMDMVPYYLYRQKNMAGNFENVGYAKEEKAGIYNVLIMEEKQTIAALGAGSISKRVYPDGQVKRCENVKDVAQYIGRIDEMIERKKQLLG